MFDDITDADYASIEAAIDSSTSPVGIDAKKTHIVILHKLMQIERRLGRLEERLDSDQTDLDRTDLQPTTPANALPNTE